MIEIELTEMGSSWDAMRGRYVVRFTILEPDRDTVRELWGLAGCRDVVIGRRKPGLLRRLRDRLRR